MPILKKNFCKYKLKNKRDTVKQGQQKSSCVRFYSTSNDQKFENKT